MSATGTIERAKALAAKRESWKGLVYLAAGLLLVGWLLNTPPGLLGKADAVGYAVCHRIDLRSFHLGERPLSLCARCTGMYLGALAGLLYQSARGRRAGGPPRRVIAALALFVAAFGVDGLNSYLKLLLGAGPLYEPHNTLRLLTGTGMGLAIAAALHPAFHQSVWRRVDPRPALPNLRSLGGMAALGLLAALLVLSGNPLALYPLSLLSAATVLALLTVVYALLWLAVLRAENLYERPGQLLPSLVGGFLVALLQIALIDAGRYLLTGTWEGFHVILG